MCVVKERDEEKDEGYEDRKKRDEEHSRERRMGKEEEQGTAMLVSQRQKVDQNRNKNKKQRAGFSYHSIAIVHSER